MDDIKPGSYIYTNNPPVEIKGLMTLRDYFAAQAMQSLLLSPANEWPAGLDISVSEAAYDMADSMLEARMKKK